MSDQNLNKERGISLAHGADHALDHSNWSRRDFLSRIGVASVAATSSLGGLPIQAFGGSQLLNRLKSVDNDRVLVLVQLEGGNDGLSTVIPVNNDVYYQRRPTLSIAKSDSVLLNDEQGLHFNLAPLEGLWQEGEMGIVHGVGYQDTVLSHFRSTDIWVSGSDADVVDDTGWVGRYIDQQHPDFVDLENPLAVQMGSHTPILFQGPTFRMGISTPSVEIFEQIAERGAIYNENNLEEDAAGGELKFLRTISNRAIKYGSAIRQAYDQSSNLVEYPEINFDVNSFARSLAAVARSIRGGLGSKIYVVRLRRFDTHTEQAYWHDRLMNVLAQSLAAFQADLAADGTDERVLTMTFSEFGRRAWENAGKGTDHGTSAPLFVLGKGAKGGFYGDQPSLTDLDSAGNMHNQVDFRSIYTSVLKNWFGLSAVDTAAILGREYDEIDFVQNPIINPTSIDNEGVPSDFTLSQNYPNPFNPVTTIKYNLRRPSYVTLDVYSSDGKKLQTLVNTRQALGSYEVVFDATNFPSGNYIYALNAGGYRQTRKMSLIR